MTMASKKSGTNSSPSQIPNLLLVSGDVINPLQFLMETAGKIVGEAADESTAEKVNRREKRDDGKREKEKKKQTPKRFKAKKTKYQREFFEENSIKAGRKAKSSCSLIPRNESSFQEELSEPLARQHLRIPDELVGSELRRKSVPSIFDPDHVNLSGNLSKSLNRLAIGNLSNSLFFLNLYS